MKYEPRWGEVRVGDRIVQPDPVGAVLHFLAIVVAGVGLVGAVYLSDVVALPRIVAALLCLVPAWGVSLGFVCWLAYRKRRHWVNIYRVKYKISGE